MLQCFTGKNEGVFQQQQYNRRKKHPALPVTDDRIAQAAQASGVSGASCIWQGAPCSVDPRIIAPAAELLEV